MTDANDLRAKRAGIKREVLAIKDRAAAEKRSFTEAECKLIDSAKPEYEALGSAIAILDAEREEDERMDGSMSTYGNPYMAGDQSDQGDLSVLTREQSVADWCRRQGLITSDTPRLNFARYLRGLATGNWTGATQERALSEGTVTAGGHLVPAPLSAQVIDLARNQTRVFQAGAVTVPMESQTLRMARLVGEGTPTWHAENAAITDVDLTFDAVTFTARALVRLVKLSVELFEDSDPSVGDVITRSFAAQIALELDRVALRGSGTAPEPRGVLNTSGITTTSHGAAGTAITNYDWWLDAAGVVSGNNFTPSGHIQAPRTTTSLSKLKEATTNAYLAPPANLLPMYSTKQVPINLTLTTSSDCSEIYTADWSQLMIGMRTTLQIEFLRERFLADNLQYGFLAYLRADVQLAQPSAFVVDVGVRA